MFTSENTNFTHSIPRSRKIEEELESPPRPLYRVQALWSRSYLPMRGCAPVLSEKVKVSECKEGKQLGGVFGDASISGFGITPEMFHS
jgi:hypothetical protein